MLLCINLAIVNALNIFDCPKTCSF